MYDKTASTELCHAIPKNANYSALSNTKEARYDRVCYFTRN